MTENQHTASDAFFAADGPWKAEYARLRALALGAGLQEAYKWGKPCYMLNGNNVVLIHGFRQYCALLFLKGALLNDQARLLVRQTENVQAARQIRFTGEAEILALEPALKTYLQNAIEVETAGLKVIAPADGVLALPEELERRFAAEPALKAAFGALTPGRRRAWTLYFSRPKQVKTREARIEKSVPCILNGKGPDDPV